MVISMVVPIKNQAMSSLCPRMASSTRITEKIMVIRIKEKVAIRASFCWPLIRTFHNKLIGISNTAAQRQIFKQVGLDRASYLLRKSVEKSNPS